MEVIDVGRDYQRLSEIIDISGALGSVIPEDRKPKMRSVKK